MKIAENLDQLQRNLLFYLTSKLCLFDYLYFVLSDSDKNQFAHYLYYIRHFPKIKNKQKINDN